MELKEFISQTMKGIMDGIAECEKQGVKINKNNFNDVVFDVAITVENTTGGSAHGKLMVVGIGIGGEMKNELSTTAISRINFHITHNPE